VLKSCVDVQNNKGNQKAAKLWSCSKLRRYITFA